MFKQKEVMFYNINIYEVSEIKHIKKFKKGMLVYNKRDKKRYIVKIVDKEWVTLYTPRSLSYAGREHKSNLLKI